MSDGPARQTFPGARLRAPRGLRVLYALSGAWALIVVAAGAVFPELRGLMLGFGAIFGVPMLLGILHTRRHSPPGGAGIEVGPEGLRVEGELAFARETIVRAVVAREGQRVSVALERRGGNVSVVEVENEAQGDALVRALGLSAAQALASFRFDSAPTAALPAWATYAYLALLPILVFLFGPMAMGMPWLAAIVGVWYLGLLSASFPTRLTVGLDGLLVQWLWQKELIRWADLRSVDHDEHGLFLTLASGARRRLFARWVNGRVARPRGGETGFASRSAYLDAVVARVSEAIAESRRAGRRVQSEVLLAKGRDARAWARELGALLARGAGGFRQAETVPEQLWGTVEDGEAEPAARAAAAVALGPALDDEGRARLRGVARVVVSPRLRISLEAAADGDEERVVEALAEIEQARSERR